METNADDPLAGIEREVLADQLRAQRDVLELEDYVLRRLMFAQPGLAVISLAGGSTGLASDTLLGDERDAWSGVYVENAGPFAVALGFAAGGSTGGGGYLVPAGTWKLIPARYVHLSVGLVDPTQIAGPLTRVTIARLRVPPMGAQAGVISAVSLGGIADTGSAAGATAAAPAINSTITSLAVPAGLYRVDVVTYEPTTPDANPANAQLLSGATVVGTLPTTSVPIATPFARVLVLPAAPVLILRTGGTIGGAGSVYFGSIAATRIA